MRCLWCNKIFIRKQNAQKYCSISCRAKYGYYKKYRINILKKFKEKYQNNKDKYIKLSSEYYYKNRERILNDIATPEYKLKRKKYMKQYQKENKEKLGKYNYKYTRNRFHNNISFRVLTNLRASFGHLICNVKSKKVDKFINIIGCTGEELKQYLEKQFKEGMSWRNYGVKGWHIDHIKPVCSFDFTNKENQLKAFYYTNLQPLWAKDNQSKGGDYNG